MIILSILYMCACIIVYFLRKRRKHILIKINMQIIIINTLSCKIKNLYVGFVYNQTRIIFNENKFQVL